MKHLLGLIALSTALASTAYADGMPEPYTPPVVLKPYSWSGVYFGLQAGVAWADADWTHLSAINHFNPVGTNRDSFDLTGAIGGGHLGFNQQFGNWVVGVEATASWASLDETIVRPGTFCPATPCNTISMDIETIVTATARLGWVADHALFYVRGGYAGARLDVSLSEVPAFPHTFSDDSWTDGRSGRA